jgi:glutathione S-transferase
MGKIPALRDGGVTLWESNAINFHAAEKAGSKLLGTNHAAVLRWLFFQSAHVSPCCIAIFRYTNAQVKAFWKTEGDAQAAAAATKELPRYLTVLEAALQKSDWLEGDFSLADIAYASHFHLIKDGGFDFAGYPKLSGWLDRLLARPAWIAARQRVVGN